MADEIGVVVSKGGRAEDMVGMHMGEDHIANRAIGMRADRRAQRRSLGEAAAGVDDRDSIGADNESDIGDAVLVGCGSLALHAVVNEYSGGDFGYRQSQIFGVGRNRRKDEPDCSKYSGNLHGLNSSWSGCMRRDSLG